MPSPPDAIPDAVRAARARHWRRTRALTGGLLAAFVGTWAAAVSVATEGGFWSTAFGAAFAP